MLISCGRKADSCKKMWFKKYPGSCECGRPYMYAILMRSDGTKQLSVAATRKHGCARTVVVCHFPWALILYYDRSTIYLLTRAVASGEDRGQLSPLGTVEPDKSSLWVDLFSLDSIILIVVTCICFLFSWGRIETPLQGSCLGQAR